MRVDSQEFARTFGNGVAAADRSDVLLNDLPAAQEALWEMLVRKALQLLPLGLVDLPRIRELRRKYTDRPMDLADAALIRIAEREGIRKIFTVDKRDFAAYRIHGRIRPSIVP
ncbi:MAG: PIN domain-containing protein [Candidatus Acidiferrales bacterium]